MWNVNLLLWLASVYAATALPQRFTRPSPSLPPQNSKHGIPLTARYVANAQHGNLSPRQNMVEDTSLHYFATLSLGQQSRTYQVLVDTGSVDLVIFNENVDTSDSDLSKQAGSCQESYGPTGQTGQTSGDIYNGPYSFAGLSTSGLFCLAPAGGTVAQDGILGLGQIPNGPNPTRVAGQTGNNPITAGSIGSFGIYFSSDGQGGTGQLTINGADSAYYQSEDLWTYEDILKSQSDTGSSTYNGYWQFRYTSYSIATHSDVPTYNLGFIDTGNPTINLDHATVNAIYSQIGAPGLPSASPSIPGIDCSYKGNAPDVVFTFGSGTTYTIPSNIYIQNGPNGGCYVAIIALDNDSSPSVFGAPFVQTYYTWFDYNDQLLGM